MDTCRSNEGTAYGGKTVSFTIGTYPQLIIVEKPLMYKVEAMSFFFDDKH